MNKLLQFGAAALFVGSGVSGVAMADDLATTNGGIKIVTEDGKFEARIGGRIQLDGNFIDTDDNALFGSGTRAPSSGLYFRRVYLTFSGKLYGWEYKIEPDFSSNNDSGATGVAFQDLYIAHEVGPGKLILGQRKPYHGLEELISSNEVTFIERPTASAVGIFGGNGMSREFQLGAYYEGQFLDNNFTYGASAFNLRRENTPATEGVGTNGRLTWSPIHADRKVIHLGSSITYEVPHNTGATRTPEIIGSQSAYYGRRGSSLTLGLGGASEPITTFGVEGGGVYGPIYVSGEYFNQTLGQDTGKDQTVTSYYIQGSYFLTGESKPYKTKDGIFGSPKVNHPWGALEAAIRYEASANKDTPAGCVASVNATTGLQTYAAGGTKCETSALLFGLNYYVNPSVRFLVNYIIGEGDQGGTLGKDNPHTVAIRAQLAF